MEVNVVPPGEIDRRIERIQELMKENGLNSLLIIQRTDLFYFTATGQNGFLYIPAEGKPTLFIRSYFPRAVEESPLENIIEIQSVRQIPELIRKYQGTLPSVMGLELDVIPVKEYRFYKDLFNPASIVDGSAAILAARTIKSGWEISQMEAVAEKSASTFEYMRTALEPGISEMEFAGRYEAFARKIGHQGELRVRHYQTEGYPWHVLSGESGGMVGVLDSPASGQGTSPAFPCGAGGKLIRAEEPVMVDMGWAFAGYHMDETRMFAAEAMPKKAMAASRAVIDIHDSIIDKMYPGVRIRDLFDHSTAMAHTMGYEDAYLGPPGYKVRFIGHGIGLELIEPPVLAEGNDNTLSSGMTLALEPKMVFPQEFCAGIESVVTITDNGARLISRVPVDIFV